MREYPRNVHWLAFAWSVFALLIPNMATAQILTELPRAEYYAGRELLGSGRIIEAASAFDTSLKRGQILNAKKWVDSIPALVMLGECYLRQGNLPLALEHYDAALMIAIDNPSWYAGIDFGPPLPVFSQTPTGIDWFPRSRQTLPVVIPDAVQVSLDPTQAQQLPDGSLVAPVNVVTRLDVAEVVEALGLALLRRWQTLGPLGPHSPLTRPLEQIFARAPAQNAPWFRTSWKALGGLNRLCAGDRAVGVQILRESTTSINNHDFFLTPIVLIALAECDLHANDPASSLPKLQEAIMLAATFEQHVVMQSSVELFANFCAAQGRTDALAPLQAIAAWTSKRSLIVHTTANMGAAELHLLTNQLPQAEKLLKQTFNATRANEITLYRTTAYNNYLLARLEVAQGRAGTAPQRVADALLAIRGESAQSTGIARGFQLQMTLSMYASGQLPAPVADAILGELLQDETSMQWSMQPVETLGWLTTPKQAAFARWLQLAIDKQDQVATVERMTLLQRNRFFESLPLSGITYNWRHALLHPETLDPISKGVLQSTLQQSPNILAATSLLSQSLEQVRRGPLPLDEKSIDAALKRTLDQLDESAKSIELALTSLSLSRKHLARSCIPSPDLPSLQQQLGKRDIVFSYAIVPNGVAAIALTPTSCKVWTTANSETIRKLQSKLLSDMGLQNKSVLMLPSMTEPDNWRATSTELAKALLDDSIVPDLIAADRVIIVPQDHLWYVPFESLCVEGVSNRSPLISTKQVTYLPTLSFIAKAKPTPTRASHSLGLYGNYFSTNRTLNDATASQVASTIGGNVVATATKNAVPNSSWLRYAIDQLWVADVIGLEESPWNVNLMPGVKSLERPTLSIWLQSPNAVPSTIMLPGYETACLSSTGNGDELFLPSAALLSSGCHSLLISRWSTPGQASSRFLERYASELNANSASASAAFQIAIFALWGERFLTENELLYSTVGGNATPMIGGSHPLLWAGYLVVGD